MPKAADFSAIYGIRHIASGRTYVGSAVRTNARWRHHRSQLQRGTHHSRYLQAARNEEKIARAPHGLRAENQTGWGCGMNPILMALLYDPRFWMLSWPCHTPD